MQQERVALQEQEELIILLSADGTNSHAAVRQSADICGLGIRVVVRWIELKPEA